MKTRTNKRKGRGGNTPPPAVCPILAKFRILAPKFANIEDEVVLAWIELTRPFISRNVFRSLYGQALALLTAHRMELVGVGLPVGDDIVGEIGGIAAFLRVASYKEGQTSISFDHNTSQYSEAELDLTIFGIQFKTLRRKRVATILSAAETRGR